MNHGGLGLIEHNKVTRSLRMLLPRDLLRTLSIGNGSTIDGIIYPVPSDRIEMVPRPVSADFAFSPIPYRLWPKVGQIRAKLVNEPGSIAAFADFLAENRVSILHSEYSRSGYRAATWNFVVVFDVPTTDDDFVPELNVYRQTVDALKILEDKIRDHKAPFLFVDPTTMRSSDSITVWPLTTLAYFHQCSRRLTYMNQDDPWMHEHTTFSCDNGALNCIGQRFPAILGKLWPREDRSLLVHYTDVSTNDVLLRTSIIPATDQARFFEVSVSYKRDAPPDTSRGFCAHIANLIPRTMRIWNLVNFTSVNTLYSEIGGTKLLIERLDGPAFHGQSLAPDIRDLLESIEGGNFRMSDEQTFDVTAEARAVSPEQLWSQIQSERPAGTPVAHQHDIFFSYAERDLATAEALRQTMADADLKCFMAKRDLQGHEGDEFAETIRQALIASREVVVLCSPHATASTWVTTEWAAAWALGKRITPILYRVDPSKLPDRLQRLQCADLNDVSAFIHAATARKQG